MLFPNFGADSTNRLNDNLSKRSYFHKTTFHYALFRISIQRNSLAIFNMLSDKTWSCFNLIHEKSYTFKLFTWRVFILCIFFHKTMYVTGSFTIVFDRSATPLCFQVHRAQYNRILYSVQCTVTVLNPIQGIMSTSADTVVMHYQCAFCSRQNSLASSLVEFQVRFPSPL